MTFIASCSLGLRVTIEALVASLSPQPSNKGSLQNQNEKNDYTLTRKLKKMQDLHR